MNNYRWMFVGIAILMLLLSACSQGNNEHVQEENVIDSELQDTEQAEKEGEISLSSVYPLQSAETLTYWLQSPTTLRAQITDVPFYQAWLDRVGVSVHFQEVSSAQAAEAFNVLLSSGDLPDIIAYNWLKLPGGPEKALEDGYILPLNDLIAAHAPNLQRYLQENPDVDKLIKTDNGDYYVFPFLQPEGGRTTQWTGPALRQDWLEELGLAVPTTIEEWHVVLTAFKERKDAEHPLTFVGQPNALQGFLDGAFIGAFGVIRDFYVDDDGKVQYGPLQQGYEQFLLTMRQWYAEGLLDRNFSQNDRKTLDANIVSGLSGATVFSSANIDRWEQALAEQNPDARLAFAPYPVLHKGDRPKFGQEAWAYGGNGSAAISAQSKHPELAAQLLDYAYSPEGYTLFNYGIEDESYRIDNGTPVLTDLILRNEENLSYVEALQLYAHSVNTGPYIQSRNLFDQVTEEKPHHNFELWQTDNLQHVLPPLTIPAEVSREYSRILTDVNTLVDELTIKIILGTEPPEAYSHLVDTLYALNIERAIDIQQTAYERFQQR